VIAVRQAADVAIARARRGDGPTLIEAVTYRLCDHTTADDARRYRSDAEVSAHWKDEPVSRLRAHLASRQLWDKTAERDLLAACRTEIDEAVAAYLAVTPPHATDMLAHLHEALPAALSGQFEALRQADGERHG
jgi:pyruvate dehydrogenase E1 component alpha subunit